MKVIDLNILMIEDDPLDAELNKEQLQSLEEYNCNITLVDNKTDFVNALKSFTPDIILCDYNLPQYNGLEALRDLNGINNLIPFIFVTGKMQEEIAADAIKAGAWDYVVKDRLFRLPLAVRSVLELRKEKEIAAKAEDKSNSLLMAIEQTSAQMVLMNKNKHIEYVNKRFIENTGFTFEEVVGKHLMSLGDLEKNSEAYEEIENKLNQGQIYKGEILSNTKDGRKIWESLSISPIRNNDNIITNFVSVKENIDERKKLEQELIDALEKAKRSDKLKDAFLQNLSHEIRTPLNAIVGFSRIMKENEDLSKTDLDSYTSIIIDSSYQLLSIVSDILTISRIQTGEESISYLNVDVNKTLEQLYYIFLPTAETKGIDLSYYLDSREKSFYINTDETKLRQILTNLINNALKFTHKGSVEFKYIVKKDTIDFYVNDTGIGIAESDQCMIFERFRQVDSIHASYGGTGLGLSISSSFAKMLGGDIVVNSEPNKGSSFCLSLPFKPVETVIEEKIMKKENLKSKTLKILIAEDEENNYQLLDSILTNSTTILLRAKNGLEAVEVFKENPKIDIILMDIKMPIMGGIEAFNEIRKINKNVPIIAQTAFALESDKQKFLEVGFTDYVSKPIKVEELIVKINSYVE